MQNLVELNMTNLYGVQILKDIKEFYKFISEHRMQTEYDDNVLDYLKLPNGNGVVKIKEDDALESDNDIKNTLPSHVGAFISRNTKRNKSYFIREINSFFNNSIYYGDMDSLYIEKKFWDVLDKACLVGDSLFQGKDDYKTGGTFLWSVPCSQNMF